MRLLSRLAELRRVCTTTFVLGFVMFLPHAQAQSFKPWVAVIPGGSSLSSMLEQCVRHYRQQGLTAKQAAGQCMAIGALRLSNSGGFGLERGFFEGGDAGASAVECGGLGIDPRLGKTVVRPPNTHFPALDKPLPKLSDQYDVMMSLYEELTSMVIIDLVQEIGALRDQIANTADPLQKQILQDKLHSYEQLSADLFDQVTNDWYLNQLNDYLDWRERHPESSPPGDYPLPDPDAPQVANVSDQAVSACQNMKAFLHECRLASWKTAPCQMFIDRLSECGDPRITDPSPEEERPCRSRPIDANTIKRVAFLACSKNTTPGPGSDPCGGKVHEGLAFHFDYDRQDSTRPICSNPFAYTDAEACTPTFSVIVSPQPSIDELIEEAQEKFGGPLVVIPLPGTNGPPPGGWGGCYKGLPGC